MTVQLYSVVKYMYRSMEPNSETVSVLDRHLYHQQLINYSAFGNQYHICIFIQNQQLKTKLNIVLNILCCFNYCKASQYLGRGVPLPKVLRGMINSLVPFCKVNYCTHCTVYTLCTDCTDFRPSNRNKLSKQIINQQENTESRLTQVSQDEETLYIDFLRK